MKHLKTQVPKRKYPQTSLNLSILILSYMLEKYRNMIWQSNQVNYFRLRHFNKLSTVSSKKKNIKKLSSRQLA
jgi:hypothetical protein